MKKAILLLFLCQISFTVFSQEYRPMIVEGNQWNVMTKFKKLFIPEPDSYWFTTKYMVGEEIIQNDSVYHEIVNQDGERAYLVYEDVEARKVYVDHQLMYDFSLTVNDTINIYGTWGYTLRLDSIKPFPFEDGSWSRIFHFSFSYGDGDFRNWGHQWIEGMGSPQGIDAYRPIIVGNGPFDVLLCLKNNDVSLYSNPNYETCDENSTTDANADIEIKEISISPNPVSDMIHIGLPTNNEKLWVRIVDVLGQTVYENQESISNGSLNLDVSNFDRGLYFISMFNDSASTDRRHFVGRFVVE